MPIRPNPRGPGRLLAGPGVEYRERWYNETSIASTREFAPIDIDAGADSTFFFKYEHGDWAYQKHIWSHGARLFLCEVPRSLVAVMDRCHCFDGVVKPAWERWKANHADLFYAKRRRGFSVGARRPSRW